MASLGSFYRGKRVLVTGHTGFSGGWLTAYLRLLGANVIGFALPPKTRPNLFDTAMLDRNIISIFGDIRNRDAVISLFAQQQPEIVIHHAAQTGPQSGSSQPIETYATAVMGTLHVLDECRYTRSLRATVVVCDENACAPDQGLYKAAMTSAEALVSAYNNEFFSEPGTTSVAAARTGNLIGGGDWTEGLLIPDLIRALASGEPTEVNRADVMTSCQHVLDALRGYLLLAKHLYQGAHDNPESRFLPRCASTSTQQLSTTVSALWHEQTADITTCSEETSSEGKSPVNPLGWEPLLNLEQALQWTVNWYRAFYKNPAMAWPIMEAQIREYIQLSGR